MYDFGFFRKELDQIATRLATRGYSLNVEAMRSLDAERRTVLTGSETLKAQRNSESQEIGKLKKAGQNTDDLQAKVRAMGERAAQLEAKASAIDAQFQDEIAKIPNLPHASVPIGKDEHDNQQVRLEGEPTKFDFTAKPHWDLGTELGILDFERGTKITGARFSVYAGLGARLERALANFMLDVHTQEHGYLEVLPPYAVNSESLFGTGQLPKFAEDLFKLEGTDYWLAPTAEVPVTNLYRGEILDEERLTVSLCAYTPCFRSEAGSHGRDVRGIIRQHQFQKVELVKFAHPDRSLDELEVLTGHAETILRKLKLPFRTMLLCTGDMGFSAQKTYDLEVWLPGQNSYKEISSCSNFGEFQARRAQIKFRSGKKTEFLHTLNGSGLAVGRTWVAIVENYQQADGSVVVPEVLRPYLNAEVIRAGRLL
jgi:seryl-tRNA synthetase